VFDSHLKSTGREYTAVIAWLALALFFIPALFLVLQASYVSVSLAVSGSVLCVVMAVVRWRTSSLLSIPTIGKPAGETK
jgi:hypothetical protein